MISARGMARLTLAVAFGFMLAYSFQAGLLALGISL
jgi:hypothetical protein